MKPASLAAAQVALGRVIRSSNAVLPSGTGTETSSNRDDERGLSMALHIGYLSRGVGALVQDSLLAASPQRNTLLHGADCVAPDLWAYNNDFRYPDIVSKNSKSRKGYSQLEAVPQSSVGGSGNAALLLQSSALAEKESSSKYPSEYATFGEVKDLLSKPSPLYTYLLGEGTSSPEPCLDLLVCDVTGITPQCIDDVDGKLFFQTLRTAENLLKLCSPLLKSEGGTDLMCFCHSCQGPEFTQFLKAIKAVYKHVDVVSSEVLKPGARTTQIEEVVIVAQGALNYCPTGYRRKYWPGTADNIKRHEEDNREKGLQLLQNGSSSYLGGRGTSERALTKYMIDRKLALRPRPAAKTNYIKQLKPSFTNDRGVSVPNAGRGGTIAAFEPERVEKMRQFEEDWAVDRVQRTQYKMDVVNKARYLRVRNPDTVWAGSKTGITDTGSAKGKKMSTRGAQPGIRGSHV